VKLIRLDEEDEIAATSIIGDQGEEDANASDEEGNLPSSDGEAKPASDGEAQPSDESTQQNLEGIDHENPSDDAQASDDQTNTPAE
jgi:hypothetical protein